MMKSWTVIILIAVMFIDCKKPYTPPASAVSYNYLVVEGVINGTADSTIFKLSRTVTLTSVSTINPELHATLVVEGDNGSTYPLTETGNGYYATASINLDVAHKYRLRINTANSQQYLSDFAAVLNSPAIDSVTYRTSASGLNVFVNTHDPTNSTRYYRWDYKETWRFNSAYYSEYVSNGDTVLPRDVFNHSIYTCWRSDTSSSIVIGNSAKLINDVISYSPLAFVGSTSEKLGKEYSMLVRQYALSSDAYNFWQNLQKNTQQLGSIFDALPSQIDGNIHCISNPSLPVIGYISVGNTSSTRLFLFAQNLPAWLPSYPAYDSCHLFSLLYKYFPKGAAVPTNQIDEFINWNKAGISQSDAMIPVYGLSAGPGSSGPPIGYTAADPICVDCTLRGTPVQPPYWRYK
jgi:Domain of unknown function (DUF4249)